MIRAEGFSSSATMTAFPLVSWLGRPSFCPVHLAAPRVSAAESVGG